MITFSVLDKAEKTFWLPKLFDLLYENMQSIAPGQLPYEQERENWLAEVSKALEKAPRQIIVCIDGDVLAGYVQYYTCEDLLMIEELQIERQYQRTTLFYQICKHLCMTLPSGICDIEAYADKRNLYSQRIMDKLGMSVVDPMEGMPYLHFRGTAANIIHRFQ